MQHWFAITPPGLEPIVHSELQGLGIHGTIEPGAIGFEASLQDGAELTRLCRTPTRLLLTMAEGDVRSTQQLASLVRSVDWSQTLRRGTEVKLHISTRDSKLRFKDRIQRTMERAIINVQRSLKPGPTHPQRLHIRIADDRCRLALDAGGELLHRRGWRKDTGAAPIRENLGAALLIAAGYTGDEVLLDPFCGVGTLPIEAAFIASKRSPFVGRSMAWGVWMGLSDRPTQMHQSPAPPLPIFGSDKEEIAIERCRANAARAGVQVRWSVSDVAQIEAPADTGLVVCNPPYGKRLGQSVDGVYRALGRTLRGPLKEWRAMFLCPNRKLASLVDRRVERLTTFSNGGSRVGIWTIEP
jgi:putative N6-adenine-specific DNA methylase